MYTGTAILEYCISILTHTHTIYPLYQYYPVLANRLNQLHYFLISQKEDASQNFSRRSIDESFYSKSVDHGARSNSGRSRSTAFKSVSGQKKANKGFLVDSKEQQVGVQFA